MMPDWLPEPELDEHGYPTQGFLEKIASLWPPEGLRWREAFQQFMEHVLQPAWHMADWGVHRKGPVWYISTGGWSGNEDLIRAMQSNPFLAHYFLAWRRGGHFVLGPPEFATKIVVYEDAWDRFFWDPQSGHGNVVRWAVREILTDLVARLRDRRNP